MNSNFKENLKASKKKIFLEKLNFFRQRGQLEKNADFVNAIHPYLKLTRQAIYNWINEDEVTLPTRERFIKFLEFPALCLTSDEKKEFWSILFPDIPYEPPSFSHKSFSPIICRPILEPEQFFGRNELMKRITRYWQNNPMEHVMIIGEKGSGKTSLLHYLFKIKNLDSLREKQKQEAISFLNLSIKFIFIDFMDARFQCPHGFIQYVLNSLEIDLNLSKNHNYDLADFSDIFSDYLIANPSKKVVLLIDNLNKQTQEFTSQFWSGLRALGTQHGNLAFCVASRELPNEKTVDSPFSNTFNTLYLEALEKEEAQEMTSFLSPQFSSNRDKEWLLEHSKCLPILVQLGYKLYAENAINWREIFESELKKYHVLLQEISKK